MIAREIDWDLFGGRPSDALLDFLDEHAVEEVSPRETMPVSGQPRVEWGCRA